MDISLYDRIVFLAVDPQNDFCPAQRDYYENPSLPVARADKIIPVLNQVARRIRKRSRFLRANENHQSRGPRDILVCSRDWHPAQTSHFAESPDFQNTWPRHCVMNTRGAEFHPHLEFLLDTNFIINKGFELDKDAYSPFQGRTSNGTNLDLICGNPELEKIALIVGGIATDYCVKAAVLDACRKGYTVFVLEDAIAGVCPATSNAALIEMKEAGAKLITVDDIR